MKTIACTLVVLALAACALAQGSAGQPRIPIEQLQIYVDGFHNYLGEDGRPSDGQTQMRVTHYCHPLPSGVIQCALFDGTTENSRLVGVEHIISDQAYQALPEKEKAFWHSHDGEVDSGMLALPGMPQDKANQLKQTIRSTHGKTWHVWDSATDELPLGQPRLMWAVAPKDVNSKTKAEMKQREQSPTFGTK
jgi:hypothetical protein